MRLLILWHSLVCRILLSMSGMTFKENLRDRLGIWHLKDDPEATGLGSKPIGRTSDSERWRSSELRQRLAQSRRSTTQATLLAMIFNTSRLYGNMNVEADSISRRRRRCTQPCEVDERKEKCISYPKSKKKKEKKIRIPSRQNRYQKTWKSRSYFPTCQRRPLDNECGAFRYRGRCKIHHL